MNFEILGIKKIHVLEKGKSYGYLVCIDMPGLDEPLPVKCTHYELLNFRELQFKIIKEYNRVITMDLSDGPYQWELYLDEVMQNLVKTNNSDRWC